MEYEEEEGYHKEDKSILLATTSSSRSASTTTSSKIKGSQQQERRQQSLALSRSNNTTAFFFLHHRQQTTQKQKSREKHPAGRNYFIIRSDQETTTTTGYYNQELVVSSSSQQQQEKKTKKKMTMMINNNRGGGGGGRLLLLAIRSSRIYLLWIIGFSICVGSLFGNLFEFLPQIATEDNMQLLQQPKTTNKDIPKIASNFQQQQQLLQSRINKGKDDDHDHDAIVSNSWLGNYIKFHKNSLEYDSIHHSYKAKDTANNNNKKDTKYLIYYCGGACGGVGDRLKGIFSALYLSICTNRVLLIDSKHPDDLANYLEPTSMEWNATPPKAYTHYNIHNFDFYEPDDNVIGMELLDTPYHRFLENPFLILEESKFHDRPIIKVKVNTWRPIQFANSTCIKQLQQQQNNDGQEALDLSQIYRYFFKSLFDWSINVKHRVQEYHHQMAGGGGGMTTMMIQQQQQQSIEPFVGVHIRTGPSTTGFDDPPRHVNQERTFYDCAKKYQQHIKEVCNNNISNNNNAGGGASSTATNLPDIFVASDNKESKEMVRQMDLAANNGNKNSNAVKFVNVDILHVDKGLLQFRDDDLKQLDIWSEMKMLYDSTCLVYSRSGFSETAAWIKNNGCSIRFDDCNNQTMFEESIRNIKC